MAMARDALYNYTLQRVLLSHSHWFSTVPLLFASIGSSLEEPNYGVDTMIKTEIASVLTLAKTTINGEDMKPYAQSNCIKTFPWKEIKGLVLRVVYQTRKVVLILHLLPIEKKEIFQDSFIGGFLNM